MSVYSLIHHKKAALSNLLACLNAKQLEFVVISSEKKNNYSFIDIIQSIIVSKTQKFGFSFASTERLKKSLIAKERAQFPISFLEKKIIEVLLYNQEYLLRIKHNGELIINESHQECILINLKEIISQTFPGLALSKRAIYLEPIYKEEKKAIQLLRNDSFHSTMFFKKDNKIDRAESHQRINATNEISELLLDFSFQNIEVKQEDGKTVYINRIIKTKL